MASAGARGTCHICGRKGYTGSMARINRRWTCNETKCCTAAYAKAKAEAEKKAE